MEQISLNLNNYQQRKSGANSERASIIEEFVDAINLDRMGTKYPPVKPKRIAIMLGVIKTNDELRRFYSECKDYGNFSRRFFGGFKKQAWQD